MSAEKNASHSPYVIAEPLVYYHFWWQAVVVACQLFSKNYAFLFRVIKEELIVCQKYSQLQPFYGHYTSQTRDSHHR